MTNYNQLIQEIESLSFLKDFEKEKLKQQIKEVVSFDFIPLETSLFSSKIFGDFYYPTEKDFPKNKHGKPLNFFLQFNLYDFEIPNLNNLNKGLLQVFINEEEEFYYDNSNLDFQLIYHANLDKENKSLAEIRERQINPEKCSFYCNTNTSYQIKYFKEFMIPSIYGHELSEKIEPLSLINLEDHDIVFGLNTNLVFGFPYFRYKEDFIEDLKNQQLIFQLNSLQFPCGNNIDFLDARNLVVLYKGKEPFSFDNDKLEILII